MELGSHTPGQNKKGSEFWGKFPRHPLSLNKTAQTLISQERRWQRSKARLLSIVPPQCNERKQAVKILDSGLDRIHKDSPITGSERTLFRWMLRRVDTPEGCKQLVRDFILLRQADIKKPALKKLSDLAKPRREFPIASFSLLVRAHYAYSVGTWTADLVSKLRKVEQSGALNGHQEDLVCCFKSAKTGKEISGLLNLVGYIKGVPDLKTTLASLARKGGYSPEIPIFIDNLFLNINHESAEYLLTAISIHQQKDELSPLDWKVLDSLCCYGFSLGKGKKLLEDLSRALALTDYPVGFGSKVVLARTNWTLFREVASRANPSFLDWATRPVLEGIFSHPSDRPVPSQWLASLADAFVRIKFRFSILATSEMVTGLFDLCLDPTAGRQLYRALTTHRSGRDKELFLFQLNRSIQSHKIKKELLFAHSQRQKRSARDAFEEIHQPDSLPFAGQDGNEAAFKMYKETEQLMRRLYIHHLGFEAFKAASERLPDGTSPELVRFGCDLADKTQIVYAGSKDGFPGAGFMITGIDQRRILPVSVSAETGYGVNLKNSIPWAEAELVDLSKTQFLLTRGLIAVTAPGKRYSLDGVPCSYLFYNEHYIPNYLSGIPVGYLVPTKILLDLVTPSLSDPVHPPGDRYPDLSHCADINSSPLSFDDIRTAVFKAGNNFYNLGWGSNLGGGLCNACRPGFGKLYRWETEAIVRLSGDRPLAFSPIVTDYNGHVHKIFADGRNLRAAYEGETSAKLEKKLVHFREAHDQIYKVTDAYQNLFDIFLISLSLWHKGFTYPRISGDNNEELYAHPQWAELGQNEPPGLYRMLEDSYKRHHGGIAKGSDRKDFRILAISDILGIDQRPHSALLDTAEMVLTIDGEKIQLPKDSDGTGSEERRLWRRYIVPRYQGPVGIAFYDRSVLDGAMD